MTASLVEPMTAEEGYLRHILERLASEVLQDSGSR